MLAAQMRCFCDAGYWVTCGWGCGLGWCARGLAGWAGRDWFGVSRAGPLRVG